VSGAGAPWLAEGSGGAHTAVQHET